MVKKVAKKVVKKKTKRVARRTLGSVLKETGSLLEQGINISLSKNIDAAREVDAEMDRITEQARRDEHLRHDNVMTQAQAIIYGEREKTYGRPEVNLETIAQFWTVYLQRKHAVQGDGLTLTKDDVCQMMVFMKSGRLLNEPGHHDSQVDQIGYIGLQERVRGR